MLLKKPRPVILMADDEENDRNLVRRAIQENDLDVELLEFENGPDLLVYIKDRAERLVRRGKPTAIIILLDLRMPEMSGLEVLEEIKGDPLLRRIPIIAFTVSESDEDTTRGYELGVNAFIVKPLDSERLRVAMRAIVHFWFDTTHIAPSL